MKILLLIRKFIQFFIKPEPIQKNKLIVRLREDAIESSIQFIKANMKEAIIFDSTEGIWDYTIEQAYNVESGFNFEFGVWKAQSLNYLSSRLSNQNWHGFDSFEGLQEDWKGWSLKKGAFDLGGVLPKVNSNVTLHKGWFNQTLPKFIETNKVENINILHIDCDTYESSKYILETLIPYIKPKTLVLFDEFFGYPGWEIGEYKSWVEIVEQYKIEFEYLAFSNQQVLLRVLSFEK
jgi:hypothetical protein